MRFRSSNTISPRCNISIKTRIVKKKYNSRAVSFCILCEIWFCMQACKGKSFGCYDSIHICPRCNSILAKYEACKIFSLNFSCLLFKKKIN